MAGWTVRTVAQRLPAILLVVLVACGGSDEPSEPVCSSLGVDAVAPATLSATDAGSTSNTVSGDPRTNTRSVRSARGEFPPSLSLAKGDVAASASTLAMTG